jgi:hypothetical protein
LAARHERDFSSFPSPSEQRQEEEVGDAGLCTEECEVRGWIGWENRIGKWEKAATPCGVEREQLRTRAVDLLGAR